MVHTCYIDTYGTDLFSWHLRPIYTWVWFRIRLAHFPKYKNNYILKNGLAYCEIALRNRTCKQAFMVYIWSIDIYDIKLFIGIYKLTSNF